MNYRQLFYKSIIAILANLFSLTAVAQVVVIVSPSTAITTLDADTISRIYLSKENMLPNGSVVEPLDQKKGSVERVTFYDVVVKKSENQLNAYWARLTFTGKGEPPEIVDNGNEVKKRVASNPKFIGYIDSAMVDSTVKVVFTLP